MKVVVCGGYPKRGRQFLCTSTMIGSQETDCIEFDDNWALAHIKKHTKDNPVTHFIIRWRNSLDRMIKEYAKENYLPYSIFPVNVIKHGAGAVHTRNVMMLEEKPGIVFVFPGGDDEGIAELAEKMDLNVVKIERSTVPLSERKKQLVEKAKELAATGLSRKQHIISMQHEKYLVLETLDEWQHYRDSEEHRLVLEISDTLL